MYIRYAAVGGWLYKSMKASIYVNDVPILMHYVYKTLYKSNFIFIVTRHIIIETTKDNSFRGDKAIIYHLFTQNDLISITK